MLKVPAIIPDCPKSTKIFQFPNSVPAGTTYLTSTVCFYSNQTILKVKTEKSKTEKTRGTPICKYSRRFAGLEACFLLVNVVVFLFLFDKFRLKNLRFF